MASNQGGTTGLSKERKPAPEKFLGAFFYAEMFENQWEGRYSMQSTEIRRTFLDFFVSKGHVLVPSSSLVPASDPTLLFTNAGMVQFKNTFLDSEPRSYKRATSAQKCMRVSGKHNDLENVGPSPRHHTFFEMLGNFSFGDYFKRDAIQFAWELITQVYKLPIERLWFSVYTDDDEAAQLWKEVGADPNRILRFGEKENFWSMGDTGPCGPCSEIHYYQGDDLAAQRAEGVNSEDDNYLEFWNLVFMQYDRDAQGKMTPLPRPSIDTGLGMERLTAILQGVKNNYETDLFVPIIERTMELLGKDRSHYEQHRAEYHTVADHSRAIAFLIADGIHPGNEGRSYVLRRILRRAAYTGQTLGFTQPFLAETADTVIDIMGQYYTELLTKRSFIKDLITAEEERFNHTLSAGLHLLENTFLNRVVVEKSTKLFSGRDAFTLHDTYGFPLDLTQKILAERGVSVDLIEYEKAMHQQQERSRNASHFKKASEGERWSSRELPGTSFTGYKETRSQGSILALDLDSREVDQVTEGQHVKFVLDRTPFYAESGGQVADTGLLIGPNGRIRIEDVQKPLPDLFVHQGIVEEGVVSIGDQVELGVDRTRRWDIMRNHTATHLLHRILRKTLGEYVEQAGSLVAPDRLRFDFTQPRQITPEQLQTIERSINNWIRADQEVEIATMNYSAARGLGAMALFGEKYGDIVRVVSVSCDTHEHDHTSLEADTEDEPSLCSRELCGGIHVTRTGEIGYFCITSEGSVSAGLRRIEALTGRGAEGWIEQQRQAIRTLSTQLGVPQLQLSEKIEALQKELKTRATELAEVRSQFAERQIDQLVEQVKMAGQIPYVASQIEVIDVDAMRHLVERLQDHLKSGIVVLGAVINDHPNLAVGVTSDLVKQGYHAGKLARKLAEIIGGGGGGRPNMAQAGGGDPQRLPEALEFVDHLLKNPV
jgi:alanyl-tRNA synthetase